MGVRQASRLDRLEVEFAMERDTDWQNRSDGVIPSPRASAMLDWVELEHPEWHQEVRALVEAIPFATLGDDLHPATQAFTRRLDELTALWEQARTPDPRGWLDPRNSPISPRRRELHG